MEFGVKSKHKELILIAIFTAIVLKASNCKTPHLEHLTIAKYMTTNKMDFSSLVKQHPKLRNVKYTTTKQKKKIIPESSLAATQIQP